MIIPILNAELDIHNSVEEIFLHRFLFKLGKSLIAIFLPLYLHELGFSLSIVVAFFLVFYGVFAFASLPSALLASRIGYRRTSMLATPLILLFYFLLRNMQDFSVVQLFGLALFGGVALDMYWIGMNSELSTDSDEEKQGREVGFFFSMSSLAAVVSPFVGGAVIAYWGFQALFTLTIVLLGLSFIPFYFSADHRKGMELELTSIFNREHLRDFSMFVFKGALDMGNLVVWPLFLAVIITGSLNIGGAGSLRALGGAIFSLVMGGLVDSGNDRKTLTVGGLLLAGNWIVMALVVSPLQAFVVSLINGLFFHSINIPVISRVMEKAREEDVLEYMAFREIGLAVGRVCYLGGLLLLLPFFVMKSWFLLGFGVLAVSVLVVLALGRTYMGR